MPPANKNWEAPMVDIKCIPRSSSNSPSPSKPDMVRRVTSRSKIDPAGGANSPGVPSASPIGSAAVLSPSDSPRARQRDRRWHLRPSSNYSTVMARQRVLFFFRLFNAAVWLISLLCTLGYQGNWFSEHKTSFGPAGSMVPVSLSGTEQFQNSRTGRGLLSQSSSTVPIESKQHSGTNPSSISIGNAKQDTKTNPSGTTTDNQSSDKDALNGVGARRDDKYSGSESEEDRPIIHLIHTRFMQYQPHLVDLGLARLELLKEFTLKSLDKQSSQDFLWVIRTDPMLNATLREPLLELLKDFDHHLVLASNENPNVQIRDLLKTDPAKVWSGDFGKAKSYLMQGLTNSSGTTETGESLETEDYPLPIVLESRLDADDALHMDFVDELRGNAVSELQAKTPIWKIWCVSRHVEWQYHSSNNEENNPRGEMLAMKDRACVTAGLTIGYLDGVQTKDLPPMKHHQLAKQLPSCEDQDTGCLDFINLAPSALRARTPTSAGMRNVLLGQNEQVDWRYANGAKKQERLQDQLWEAISPSFGFTVEDAIRVKTYLESNLHAIAMDNLVGQCSSGHSCKNASKVVLQSIINETQQPNET